VPEISTTIGDPDPRHVRYISREEFTDTMPARSLLADGVAALPVGLGLRGVQLVSSATRSAPATSAIPALLRTACLLRRGRFLAAG
jgi:hypothetical protein